MKTLRIAMGQINPTVGALRSNAKKMLACARRAEKAGASLVLFPELALTGYPPEDLLLKPGFIDDNLAELHTLAGRIRGITAVVGFVDRAKGIYNAAAVMHRGRVRAVYRKMFLPNYGVFDEKRYFRAGIKPLNIVLCGVCIGLGICEDVWHEQGPVRAQAKAGASVIVNINASPYHAGKGALREEMLARRAAENGVVIAYNNTVGGQDELVFDGQGLVVDPRGTVLARGRAFEEDLIVVDIPVARRPADTGADAAVRTLRLPGRERQGTRPVLRTRSVPRTGEVSEVLRALVLGTRDYVRKNGFSRAVIALSGGIDSSLVAALACRALGAENITGVFMPSKYTSRESREDARELAANLGVELMTIPINTIFSSYRKTLRASFEGTEEDIAEENIQARIRGNIIMALSNKFGWLVLTTGNKSEMSVGYATLYGDMAGGFAVIKDVPKTLAYEVAEEINREAGHDLIPARVLTKAPTAELRPVQLDSDTLPPYGVLDAILKAYVEEDLTAEEIAAMGFKKGVVKKVLRMVDRSEYKRRQSPPGIKITPRAFGRDRRMPITNGYGK